MGLKCSCATQWCNLNLTFDLSVVTLTFKNLVCAVSLKLYGIRNCYLAGILVARGVVVGVQCHSLVLV